MASRSALTWSGDLKGRLAAFGPHVHRSMVAAAKYIEPQAERYMKDNATWTDRTGNARNGLKAQTEVERTRVTIYLSHQVPYGPFLELRWSGRYQIINPTIEVFAPQLMELISDLAFKSGDI